MKVRSGFVSNSSSASFIIAIGRVTDRPALEKWLKENDIKTSGYNGVDIISTSEECNWLFDIKKGHAIVSSFDDTEVSLPISSEPETLLVVNDSEEEGDSFYCEDDDCCPDYDIDESHFEGYRAKLLDLPKAPGLADVQLTFGAGRNG